MVDACGQVRFLVMAPAPDDAPDNVKEGVTRRRLVSIDGRCPCGATLGPSTPPRHCLGSLLGTHQRDCPASDEALAAAIREWRTGAA